MSTVLIVDDDPTLREALVEAIRDLGHETHAAASGAEALALLDAEDIHAAFLDLRMPGMDGLDLLRRIQARDARPVVTVLTAYATAANTIEAMRLGAFDHVTKPIGRADIAQALSRMLAVRAAPLPAGAQPVDKLVGSSEAMRTIQKSIGLLADSDATVLIIGETGTGKELVAQALHDYGRRKSGPFVAVNCASIPAELMESELFGHVKGAFTGALSERLGAFRQANGGTLLLDEIGDMDLVLQAKILRALQERVITPIGGKATPVDVRVIAATHRHLKDRVSEGLFRQDLFYRLYVVPITLPPLRERMTDIVPLAEHFLTLSARGKSLTADAAAKLMRYDWPGNIRELRNAMERAGLLARGNQVGAADLAFLDDSNPVPAPMLDWPDEDLPSAVARLEELLIRRALARCSGNRSEAAKVLNINRQLLYTKLKRYGIEPGDAGQDADE
jgi:DNA-binding NtrC family response regulator